MKNREDFKTACGTILHYKDEKALNYCVGYAKAGLALTEPTEIQVQCLYILNNMTGWRGPIAATVRDILKRLSKPSAWEELTK